MPRLTTVAIAAFLVVLVAGGCSDSSRPSADASGSLDSVAAGSSAFERSKALATTITIKRLAFSPTAMTAKVGDTITVTNEDGTDHSVTADDGSFDTKPFSSGSRTFVAAKAGTFEYHCAIHSSMHGELQISES